jgi:hypothetical protein
VRGGRVALATGALVALVYVGSAALSGHLSPLARRPLLDGYLPPTAYRWVDPPPALASTNNPPKAQDFGVELGSAGSKTAVLTTDDAQVTVILPRGAFAGAGGQRNVVVHVEPLAPSAVSAAAPEPGEIIGNVYLLEAEYRPSGDPAPLAANSRVVLVYPLVANDHGSHELLVSGDGAAWTAADTNDLPSIQQADAEIRELGYVAVAATNVSPTASAGPGSDEGGGLNPAVVGIAAGLIVLVIGAAIVLRPSRPASEGARDSRRDSNRRSE